MARSRALRIEQPVQNHSTPMTKAEGDVVVRMMGEALSDLLKAGIEKASIALEQENASKETVV